MKVLDKLLTHLLVAKTPENDEVVNVGLEHMGEGELVLGRVVRVEMSA
jgi:hypothetical protein